MNSFLTDEEIDAINASDLPRDTPFLVQYVSHGMFSIARHYGGAKIQGKHYTYLPLSDELIRDDALKFISKRRKEAAKAKKGVK